MGSKITHVGIPDSNVNQLTVDQLALGPPLLQRVANPFFGTIPRSSSLGDPTITVAQLMKPFPDYTTVSLYRNNVGNTRYQGLEVGLRQRFSHGLSYTVAYTRSKLIDTASSVFDASILTGPVANYPIADSHNLALERDYSTGDIPHVFVSSVLWDLPAGAGRARQLHGIWGALVNDWSASLIATHCSRGSVAVTQTTNFNAFAGFGVQRRTSSPIGAAGRISERRPGGSTRMHLPSRRGSRSDRHPAPGSRTFLPQCRPRPGATHAPFERVPSSFEEIFNC